MVYEHKVSVIMLTYNHAPFIKDAIEGVIKQKANFSFELIICNDCSPDETDDIVLPYVEKYPHFIRYFKHSKNIGFVENQRFAFRIANSEYIAYCEGDDYWTDDTKLQWQVNFLDHNEDYVMVTARNTLLLQNSKAMKPDGKDDLFNNLEFIDYNQASFFNARPTQTFTYLIRRSSFDLSWIDKYPDFRDLHYFYHCLGLGKGRAFNKIIGVYRLHEGGVFSSLTIEKKAKTSIDIFTNIKLINNDSRANEQIIRDYTNLINQYLYKTDFKLPITNVNLYKAIWSKFKLEKKPLLFFKNILQIFKHSIR